MGYIKVRAFGSYLLRFSVTINTRRVAFAAIILLGAQSAFAAPADDARGLMAQGQYAQALQKLDQHLSKNPQDAEARFARGIALTKLNRTSEATKAFTDLTRDYPQLPEPYNNLAVLYAQQGNYDKARSALEAALATHPSYATAHENLGDIYAALANTSYNRALALDQSNQSVRTKIALLGQIEKPSNRSPAKPVAPVAVAAAPVAAPVAAPAATIAAPAPVAPKAAAATPAPTTAATTPTTSVDDATATAIAGILSGWSKAWSSKDAPAYLDYYASDFAPEGGQLRAAWAEQRRDRILKPSRITVTIKNPTTVRVGADQLRVSFTQDYRSDNYSDSVNKILLLKPVSGTWKIVREYSR